jgi:16S rRNA (adenine1518-N6/adenine1519-N6)-dimethyltransferase
MKAIKDLGQHFLNNSDIALSIADLANLEPGETVWEIGPGTGILSAELIKRQVMLSAFELDKRMAEILHQRFSHNFRLVLRDILKVNWAEELAQAPNPIKLVANTHIRSLLRYCTSWRNTAVIFPYCADGSERSS